VWTKDLGIVEAELESRGMSTWPDTRFMRLYDPGTERLTASGTLGLRVANLIRELTFWRLAVMMVDENARSKKARITAKPPWNTGTRNSS